jgi:hypothetical protein
MASLDEVLACYGELAGTVARMVELARARRWDALPGLDAHCSSLVGRLREMDGDELSGIERSRLAALASRIRSDQEALSSLVRPQFVHLAQRMAELQRAS